MISARPTSGPRGGTPLFDAIGRCVELIDARAGAFPAEDQVLVIITDGMDNASTDYDAPTISNLLDERQETGWTVMFLGANQDSFATAGSLKMKQGNVRDFDASSDGIKNAVVLTSDAVFDHRSRSRSERRQHKDRLFDETEKGRT